ncbi:MAG: hypothetical protein AAF627_11090 [Myxococcota bacterium]
MRISCQSFLLLLASCGADPGPHDDSAEGCKLEVHDVLRLAENTNRGPSLFPLELRNQGDESCDEVRVQIRNEDGEVAAAQGPFVVLPDASLSGFSELDPSPGPNARGTLEVLLQGAPVARIETLGGGWPLRLLAVPNEIHACRPNDPRAVYFKSMAATPMTVLGVESTGPFRLGDGFGGPETLQRFEPIRIPIEVRADAESEFGVVTLRAEYDGVISTAGVGGRFPSLGCSD